MSRRTRISSTARTASSVSATGAPCRATATMSAMVSGAWPTTTGARSTGAAGAGTIVSRETLIFRVPSS